MTDPIVLLHGLGGSHAIWDRVRPLLPGTVSAPDLAGTESIEVDALDVARRIRAADLGPVILVGHSRGGLVATSVAEQFPTLVGRLVLVATPPTVASRLTARGFSETVLGIPLLGAAVWSALPDTALERGLATAFLPGGAVPDFAVQDLRDTGLQRFRASSAAVDTYLDGMPLGPRLATLGCPVSVVYGLDDRRVDSSAMADSASGPGVSAYPLPREGHGAPWSSAGAVAAVITDSAQPRDAERPTSAPAPRLRPVRWTPPRATDRARQASSAQPMSPIRRLELPGRGPEDVRLDSQGRVLTGLEDGRILRVTFDSTTHTVETLADTGGRPLGITVLDDDTLLVCDAERGVLRVDLASGGVEVLVDQLDGEPITFASNIVRGRSGTLYFTVSTRRFGFHDFLADLLEHSGTGRVAVLPPDGPARTLVDGLQFPNGLTVSDAEDAVTVASSGDFRITRYPVVDGRAGAPTVLEDNLPAFPDNVSADGDLVWVAMATPRSALHDRVAQLPGLFRRIAYRLPESVREGESTTWVIAVDEHGTVVHDLQSSEPGYKMVTGVVRRGPHLVLGSITESALAVVGAPTAVES
ncbi:hypothetical protein ASG56_03200 [Rhodococcus sp. Leaf7]|uniref:alpha/beta fold hydrolase n=1 Tax=unclassified Rhodococcus (in: high G+C Gram-positive bacteria) TaxID=192944 RepID=UPI0006FCA724|nr:MULTISPECIES: alpha/beta fold hydrolase [unclassified Rhodococcus (in: high G+C Gram-positive bacteria)]KQU06665.1 hypothetical protein ASG56_03200 [Rhodococcus sp. Leaf7]KQU42185.1 hypothetical protein ASG64_03200 [Rhodococcus sp. Leaf247]